MNDIKNQIDSLFNEVMESKLYNDYISVSKRLEENKDIMLLIEEIKRLQKLASNIKDNNVELEIKKLYDTLDSYPIYQSYLIIKDELSEELLQISNTFNSYFKDILSLD